MIVAPTFIFCESIGEEKGVYRLAIFIQLACLLHIIFKVLSLSLLLKQVVMHEINHNVKLISGPSGFVLFAKKDFGIPAYFAGIKSAL
jgi:hypothetical protein